MPWISKANLRGPAGQNATPDMVAAAVAAADKVQSVVWHGHSLISQGGGLTPPVNPPAYLAEYIDAPVYTNAVGGEAGAGIAARQGGMPYMIAPVTIPASGTVTVTLTPASGYPAWPLLQTNGNPALGKTLVGTVAGVHGTVALVQPSGANAEHQPDDYYTFTRTTAGTALTLTRPAPLYTDFAIAHRNDFQIFQSGTNGFKSSAETVEVAVEREWNNLTAMIEYGKPGRFIVVGEHAGTAEGTGTLYHAKLTEWHRRLKTFGRRFVNYYDYLLQYGLEDAGMTATAEDLADIASGSVPRQLMTDGKHLQIPTRRILGRLVGARMVELGLAGVRVPFAFADNFNRPDGTELGADWATPHNFQLLSSKLTKIAASSAPAVLLSTKQLPTPNGKISAKITRGTSASTGLVIRAADANNYVAARINLIGTGNILIYKVVGGVTTSLSGANDLWTADGATLELSAVGDTYTAKVDGVQKIAVTHADPALSGNRKFGVRASSEGATLPTYDDFTATEA
jgi:hypothetical protein